MGLLLSRWGRHCSALLTLGMNLVAPGGGDDGGTTMLFAKQPLSHGDWRGLAERGIADQPDFIAATYFTSRRTISGNNAKVKASQGPHTC